MGSTAVTAEIAHFIVVSPTMFASSPPPLAPAIPTTQRFSPTAENSATRLEVRFLPRVVEEGMSLVASALVCGFVRGSRNILSEFCYFG